MQKREERMGEAPSIIWKETRRMLDVDDVINLYTHYESMKSMWGGKDKGTWSLEELEILFSLSRRVLLLWENELSYHDEMLCKIVLDITEWEKKERSACGNDFLCFLNRVLDKTSLCIQIPDQNIPVSSIQCNSLLNKAESCKTLQILQVFLDRDSFDSPAHLELLLEQNEKKINEEMQKSMQEWFQKLLVTWKSPLYVLRSFLATTISQACSTKNVSLLEHISHFLKKQGMIERFFSIEIDKRRILFGSDSLPLLSDPLSLMIYVQEDKTKLSTMEEPLRSLVKQSKEKEEKLKKSREFDATLILDAFLLLRDINDHPELIQLLDGLSHLVPTAGETVKRFQALTSAWELYTTQWTKKKGIIPHIHDMFPGLEYEEHEGRKEAEEYRTKGNLQFQAGNLHEAIRHYTHAITLFSSHPIFYANRAACYVERKENKKCEEDCRTFLRLPWFPFFGSRAKHNSLLCKVYYRYALAVFKEGRSSESLQILSPCFSFESHASKAMWDLYCDILASLPANSNPSSKITPFLATQASQSNFSWSTPLPYDLTISWPSIEKQEELEILFIGDGTLHFFSSLCSIQEMAVLTSPRTIRFFLLFDSVSCLARSIFFFVLLSEAPHSPFSLFTDPTHIYRIISLFTCKTISKETLAVAQRALSMLIAVSSSVIMRQSFPWFSLSNALFGLDMEVEGWEELLFWEVKQEWLFWFRAAYEPLDVDVNVLNPLGDMMGECAVEGEDVKSVRMAERMEKSLLSLSASLCKENIPLTFYNDHVDLFQSHSLIIFHPPIQYQATAIRTLSFDYIFTGTILRSLLPILSFFTLLLKDKSYSHAQCISKVAVRANTTEKWLSCFEKRHNVPISSFEVLLDIYSSIDIQKGVIVWQRGEENENNEIRCEVEDLWDVVTTESRFPNNEDQSDQTLNSESFWSVMECLCVQEQKGRNLLALDGLLNEFFFELGENDSVYALMCSHAFYVRNRENLFFQSSLASNDLAENYLLTLFGDCTLLQCFVDWTLPFDNGENGNENVKLFVVAALLEVDVLHRLQGEKLYHYFCDTARGRDMQIIDSVAYSPQMNLLSFFYPLAFFAPDKSQYGEEEVEIPQPVFFLMDQETHSLAARPLQVKQARSADSLPEDLQ